MKSTIIALCIFSLLGISIEAKIITALRPKIQEVAQKEKLDPVLMEAIMRYESGHGKSRAAREKNNLAGIMGKGSLRRYKSKEESVEHLGRVLVSYRARGKVTVEQIGRRYCPTGPSAWRRQITSMMDSIKRGRYGKIETKA